MARSVREFYRSGARFSRWNGYVFPKKRLPSRINELSLDPAPSEAPAQARGNPPAGLSRLQVGEWWADPTTNELGRAGEIVRIEPKAMEVLMVLAGRSGRVVGRDELLAAVWPGVVVGDEVLTQSIIKLRKALGDNPRSPSHIETISKRGYRLIAPVRGMDAARDARAGSEAPSPTESPGRRHGMRSLGLAALAVVAVIAVVALSMRPEPYVDAEMEALDAADSRKGAPLSVTVLPFEVVGAGRDHQYLAHGISNDLTTELSRFSGLRLISGTGSAAAPDPGPSYVVSGSVQREAGLLRVNVRLIDPCTKEQLWSERFERPFRDLFAVQDEIIHRLVEQLPGRISDAEKQRLAKRYTRSLEAYDSFLRGRALFLVRRTEDNEQARAYFRKALELDPGFARAYASLAMTYALEFRLRPAAGSSAALDRAFELAETARLIDPDIPEIHWALGFVHVQGRRHEKALESLKKAIALDRSYADAYALMGGIYTYIGEPRRTIPLLRAAMRLNPDGGYLYFQILGRAYFFENDFEQALINLREATDRNPADLETRLYYAGALAAAGHLNDARWVAEEIRALDSGFSTRKWLETYPMTSRGQQERLAQLLEKAGL
jgi:DNA-binding winged helix-turn-helix (wHTH) protein/TolB-like protein/Tfp pilus assembly protein PilF